MNAAVRRGMFLSLWMFQTFSKDSTITRSSLRFTSSSSHLYNAEDALNAWVSK